MFEISLTVTIVTFAVGIWMTRQELKPMFEFLFLE
jgi:hypothetical protein